MVIESGGFSEFDEENERLERDLLSIAQKWQIRLVGPNCIGIINLENGLVLPFTPLDHKIIKVGNVSLVSQSGGIDNNIIRLFSCENIGFNKFDSNLHSRCFY